MRSEITYLFLVELLFSCPREKKNSAKKKRSYFASLIFYRF